ncbi:MAG TPA: type II toxin-antitoxin system PemK/MazF family toxin [Candidatus Limnocylindrales bacterium]|nr:type II toxin-antitoxin system PemK/MazF family toxin [Candidatus Limnocylindrales bacterium]
MGKPRVVGIGRAVAPGGPRRGDIHFIAFPDLGGNVLRGPHPAVVVQTERMQRSSTVVVLPMTSSPRSAAENPPYLVAVRRQDSGLDRDSFVKTDQPATLPVTVLGPRAGRLSPEAITRVDASLRFVLAL